jgi:hypothetical protein
MSTLETTIPEDEALKSQVESELDKAKKLTRSFNIEDVKSGDWFNQLLQKVIRAYDRNATAAYFQQKYPGLPSDEIADILTSVTVRYATIAGAITGAVATVNQMEPRCFIWLKFKCALSSIFPFYMIFSLIQMIRKM